MALHGVDVSEHQGSIDWKKVKPHHTFAICKATEGTDYKDKRFSRERRRAVRGAKLLFGAYHFARPSDMHGDSEKEAAFFVKTAKAAGWNPAVDLPLALDVEATKLTPKQTLVWCDQFASHVKRLTGRGCILYTGQWFWDGRLHLRRAPKNANVLWFSAYTTQTRMKRLLARMFGFKPFLWQYTSSARVSGIAGNVDRNVSFVSDRAFKRLIHK